MKIYIIGNSKGPAYIFQDAAVKLEELGHTPVFCHGIVGETDFKDWEWTDFRKHFLKAMLDCDMVVTLPEYQSCRGARIEYDTAIALEMKIETVFEFVHDSINSPFPNPL